MASACAPTEGVEQVRELVVVSRGPVEGRVELHPHLGDGVLENINELSEIPCGFSLLYICCWGTVPEVPRYTMSPVGTFLNFRFLETSLGWLSNVQGSLVAGLCVRLWQAIYPALGMRFPRLASL